MRDYRIVNSRTVPCLKINLPSLFLRRYSPDESLKTRLFTTTPRVLDRITLRKRLGSKLPPPLLCLSNLGVLTTLRPSPKWSARDQSLHIPPYLDDGLHVGVLSLLSPFFIRPEREEDRRSWESDGLCWSREGKGTSNMLLKCMEKVW